MKKLIIRMLGGHSKVQRIRRVQQTVVLWWLRLAYRIPLIGRLHYALFSDSLALEGQAVIAGRIRFIDNQEGVDETNYYLRRAVHRLEKGLIMEPRRPIFAVEYIEAAVSAYKNSLGKGVNETELLWARDVLREYFRTVSSHPVVDKARVAFEATSSSHDDSSPTNIPYPASNRGNTLISYEEFEQLAMHRRSVRWYEQHPVPRLLIDKAIKVALQAPSACNRQPYSFLIYDDPAMIEKVGKLPMGVAGFDHNFPVLIAVVGRLRAYSHPRDRHAIYVDGSLAAMGFMYALETLGLSTCPINWPDIPERELAARKLLHLDPDERIVMFISVGYARPSGGIPFSEKAPIDQARVYNPTINA